MPQFDGSLRMPGEPGPGLVVHVDLDRETLRLSAGASEIGRWSLDEIRVNAMDDGFHVRAEGEEIVLDVAKDAEFAVALGLRTAPPLLRRKMAALLRES